MNVSQIRQEFSIYLFDGDLANLQRWQGALSEAGYAVRSFPTVALAQAALRTEPAHIVLLNVNSFVDEVEAALQMISEASHETLVIALTDAKQEIWAMQQVSEQRFYDFQKLPAISELELFAKIDRALAQIFVRYENEQLREHHGLPVEDQAVQIPNVAGLAVTELSNWIQAVASQRELQPSLQAFMQNLSEHFNRSPMLYFKYVPSHATMVVTQACWLPMERLRGVGIQLGEQAPEQVTQMLRDPGQLQPLKKLLRQAFHVEKYVAFTHYVESAVQGVFVLFNIELSESQVQELFVYKQIFDLTYRRNLLLKDLHSLRTHDPLTGLANRVSFRDQLEVEVSRSRRLGLPLSLLCFDIDQFHSLNQQITYAKGDDVLKSVANLVKRGMRATDILARTGSDEFMLLMPHTDATGAAVKAERLRRLFRSSRLYVGHNPNDRPITISGGISAFPVPAADADALVRTADLALAQMREAGGDRVCLARPVDGEIKKPQMAELDIL